MTCHVVVNVVMEIALHHSVCGTVMETVLALSCDDCQECCPVLVISL